MFLKKVTIRNVKTYSPEVSVCFNSQLNLIVGPNGKGKSNLFEILQGVINNVLFRHITVQQNPERKDHTKASFRVPFSLQYDNIDTVNLSSNILDRHFKHLDLPASVNLRFEVTKQDVEVVISLISQSKQIEKFLKEKVLNSEELSDFLQSLNGVVGFDFLIGKEIDLRINEGSAKAEVCSLDEFDESKRHLVNTFCEIIHYLNAFHELSSVKTDINVSPLSFYIGPTRYVSQLRSVVPVDLNESTNFENAFSKGVNRNQEMTPAIIDSSYHRLCYLHLTKQRETISTYKRYLKSYLDVDLKIKKVNEIPHRAEYEIRYTRGTQVPLKLSSGEKEFFNLITGLILSGIKNGLILIDEPELHLHANWQGIVLKLIRQLSKDFNLQFLIISHSPKLITVDTLSQLYRVGMPKPTYSKVIEPNLKVLSNSKAKDLITFTNATNSEKIFFSDVVVLVEGISDLIIVSAVIDKLKESENLNKEIAVIQVGSKNNLLKFREFLSAWDIKNYIVADLDFIREYLNYQVSNVANAKEKNRLNMLNAEFTRLVSFSSDRLRKLICDKDSKDRDFLFQLIESSGPVDDSLLSQLNDFKTYLINERASTMQGVLSANLVNHLNKVAESHGVRILTKGAIEKYFAVYCSNKVDNAQEIAKQLDMSAVDTEILNFIKRILNELRI